MNHLFLKKYRLLVPGFLFLFPGAQAYQARLILNGGKINISQGAYLVIANPASNAITRNSGHIISNGENNILRWHIGTTTGNYIIPWGDNTNYFPLSLTPTSATGNGWFDFAVYPTAWNNSSQLPTGITLFTNPSGADNSAFVIDRFWRIDAQNYSTKPALSNLVFTYLDTDHSAPGNTITESNLQAQRYNDNISTWGDYGPAGTVNTTNNTVTISSLAPGDLFKWWTLVDQLSPLPVDLVSFTAKPEDKYVRLNWVTETEWNNDYFTVEKSLDGIAFVFVGNIDGAGWSTKELTYSTLDKNPWSGVSYYRLRQTDFDGKQTYSTLVSVLLGQGTDFSFDISPNPITGKELTLKFNNNSGEKIKIKILSLVGREVFTQIIPASGPGTFTSTITLPDALPSGVYLAQIEANNTRYTKIFISSN